MKKTVLAVLMALCVVALAACGGSQQEHFDTADNPVALVSPETPVPATPTPAPVPDFDTGDYDPASEEGLSGLFLEKDHEEPVPFYDFPLPTDAPQALAL